MTVAELLPLPAGAKVIWTPCGGEVQLLGQIARSRPGRRLLIVWEDGTDCRVHSHDDDLAEFAAWLERADDPTADQPLVIDRPRPASPL